MSRIEKAMEKAARFRLGKDFVAETRHQFPVDKIERIHADSIKEKVTSDCIYLVNINDPYSPNAEEFRKMKSALVKMTKGETFKNVIMVTSSLPHEGKSITALNLAVSLAQEYDHTVLLVDADLRRPSINRYLNLDHKPGFSECLLGEADISEAIINTDIGSLSVITSGRSITNPVELFTSQRMQLLIDEMKNRYPDRYIIIDTPPVLPFAETRTLSHMVDGVLFVVKERLASHENITEAIAALKGSELLGLIYNDTTLEYNDERYSYFRSYADLKP